MSALADRSGRSHSYLRVSVTDRCNLRCRYCTPQDFVWKERDEILSYEEICRVARLLVAMGIRKIRLTGGEPTVRKGIEGLVARLAALPGLKTLGMTTNGTLLKGKARALKTAGLTALNVSLDTLKKERFRDIAGEDRFDQVMAGIEAALAAGFAPLKLNVVVMGGVNDDELCDFVEFARANLLHLRFIEYMPFRGNGWDRAGFVPHSAMVRKLAERYSLTPCPSRSSSSAKEFRVDGRPETIGFITPLSAHFCQTCNRLRLTADGAIRSCLFGPDEASLRGPLREGASDAALADIIRAAVAEKPAWHPPVRELAGLKSRSMIEIGG
jgi:cyclic pyranopterin phosphate synthase